MRDITLSADEDLLERARRRAESEHRTLNNLFRQRLARYVDEPRVTTESIRQAVAAAAHFRVGHSLTREERNERLGTANIPRQLFATMKRG
jgi:predicted transcriptional regulator